MLTAEQLAEWSEFLKLEPMGFDVDEARAGRFGTIVAGAMGAKVPPEAFMLRPPEEEPDEAGDPVADYLRRTFKLSRPPPESDPVNDDQVASELRRQLGVPVPP